MKLDILNFLSCIEELLSANYMFQRKDVLFINITAYLKNHWTKHRDVCTHFDAFSMLILNMDMKCNISEIFEHFEIL